MTRPQTQTESSERSSSVEAIRANPKDLSPRGWKVFAELIAPAVARQREVTLLHELEEAAADLRQLWFLLDPEGDAVGAVLTSVVTYQSGLKACVIVFGSTTGTDLSWESMRGVVATIEAFAADCGCDIVRIHGRRGWVRVFKDYNPAYVTLEKNLGGVH